MVLRDMSAVKRNLWKATGSAGNEGEKAEGECNATEKTKAFSAAQVSSFKFRGNSFSSCSGPPVLLLLRCRSMLG